MEAPGTFSIHCTFCKILKRRLLVLPNTKRMETPGTSWKPGLKSLRNFCCSPNKLQKAEKTNIRVFKKKDSCNKKNKNFRKCKNSIMGKHIEHKQKRKPEKLHDFLRYIFFSCALLWLLVLHVSFFLFLP